MTPDPPPHVSRAPRLAAIWKRTRHILPEANFDERFTRTVFLPIKGKRVQEHIALLRDAIAQEPGASMRRISELSGLRKKRTAALLHMREGIEWRSERFRKGGTRNFYIIPPSTSPAHVPEELSVEYLVAELERWGVEFRVDEVTRTLWCSSMEEYPDMSAWLGEVGRKIREYVLRRDGLSPTHPEPPKFSYRSRVVLDKSW